MKSLDPSPSPTNTGWFGRNPLKFKNLVCKTQWKSKIDQDRSTGRVLHTRFLNLRGFRSNQLVQSTGVSDRFQNNYRDFSIVKTLYGIKWNPNVKVIN